MSEKIKELYLWDNFQPLSVGTKVKFIKNLCRPIFKGQPWYESREALLGATGIITEVLEKKDLEDVSTADYFYRRPNKYFYLIEFPTKRGWTFFCIREELEVVR